ncbi:hypothetical protein ES703_45724 [subsurface metagenome]
MKSPLVITSITVAALLIIAGAGYFILGNFSPPEPPTPGAPVTQPPPPPKENAPPPEPAVQGIENEPPAKPPAPSFEEKIENFKQAIADVYATGESQEVILVLTEAEINEQAGKRVTQFGVPGDIPLEVKSVYIDLQTDNNLVTEVGATSYGIEVTIKVETRVGVKEGKPSVEVTDISSGNPLLDAVLKDKFIELIAQNTGDLLVQLIEGETGSAGKVDLEFTDITVQKEEITFTIIIKPIA